MRSIPTRKWLYRRLKKQGGKCFYCGCRIYIRPPSTPVDIGRERNLEMRPHTLDHVTPSTKGGKHSGKNLVLACGPCNNDKGDRMPTPEELSALASIVKLPKRQPR